jgi:hypothetical protein
MVQTVISEMELFFDIRGFECLFAEMPSRKLDLPKKYGTSKTGIVFDVFNAETFH